jgi:hypothetical protein
MILGWFHLPPTIPQLISLISIINYPLIFSVLVVKHEGETIIGNPRGRWEDNIKTDLKEIEWKGVD